MTRWTRLWRWKPISAAALVLVTLPLVWGPARADVFLATNLVTDAPAVNPAPLTDPNLRNAWGIGLSAASPFWVANNATGVSTLYLVNAATNVPTKVNLEVAIAGTGRVTGLANNPGGAGAFNGDTFLFVGEDGTVSGWRTALGTTAEVLATGLANNVYKGATAATVGGHAYLYAANFHTGNVDVLKGDTGAPDLVGRFTDPNLPAGYGPFGIQKLGNTIYVTYALLDAAGRDDVPGAGHGLVNAFDLQGTLLGRVGTMGTLNSPWGLALAPSSFGSSALDLLVGNFGDGRVNVFDPTTHAFLGQLSGPGGQPLVVTGLWGLSVGNSDTGGTAGSSGAVYFTAGPNGETHGLFGVIQPVPEPSTLALAGLSAAGLAYCGRRPRVPRRSRLKPPGIAPRTPRRCWRGLAVLHALR
ncbi:MAG TPA: TIGR03118 family protein [Gemmataceae bacterium]|jgi:uncharacterized protein (TIGR03118 family)